MQSIKTLSAVDPYAVNQANFPLLLSAITRASVTDDGTFGYVTDLITGQVFYSGVPLVTSFESGLGFALAAADALTHDSGAFPALGSDPFIAFAIGDYSNTEGVLLGANSGAGPGIKLHPAATGTKLLRTTGNSHTIGALSSLTNVKGMAITRAANASLMYGADASQNMVSAAGSATLTIDGAWGALANALDIPNNTTQYCTGIFLMTFPGGLPSAAEIRLALAWMIANPGQMWPGFYLRTA